MNGEDALEYMRTERPDLVVTDNRMPGMTGSEMVSKMAEDDSLRTIPVIMHSSTWVPRPDYTAGMRYRNSEKSCFAKDDLLQSVEWTLELTNE